MSEDPDSDEDGEFVLSLMFTAEDCPGCGEPGEPGPCPSCGTPIPATEAVNDETRARLAAIGPLREQAADLIRGFDQIRLGGIPVSLGQFATAMTDGKLYERAGGAADIGAQLATLDLNDRATIGSTLRQVASERLREMRELLGVCEELAAMAPVPPGEEARELAIAAGRYGAELLLAYLAIVTSPNIAEAREHEQDVNRLLDGFPPGQRMSELLDQITELPADDADERVARVLGRGGSYTDELDMLSLSLVFGAFADHEQPFLELAARAREYFGDLLPEELPEPSWAALLAIPAVTVGTLDRPLLAHRCARLLGEVASKALLADPVAVQALLERTTEQGAVIFSASSRIDRSLRLLALGERAGVTDDIAALDVLLKAYLELAESGFRTIGWLALDLARIADGAPVSSSDRAPMLGSLEEQLAASADPLCRELAAASDSGLRNAAAHAQYAWEPTTEEVVDLRTGQRWTLEELDLSMNRLVGAVAGSDAGYACFIVGRAIELPTPRWAQDIGAGFVTRLIADASFGAYGYVVQAVADDGAHVLLSDDADANPLRLLPPLVGLAVVRKGPETYRVARVGSAEPLLEVSGETLRAANDAAEHLRDLATVAVVYEVIESRGDAVERTREAVALLAKVVAVTAFQQLASGPHTSPGFMRIAERASYARQFALARQHGKDPVVRDAIKRFERVRAASFAARTGKRSTLNQLLSVLRGLFDWAEARGARWPPA